MRRMLLVLSASLIMAAMLMALAVPALAQGPQTIPPGVEKVLPKLAGQIEFVDTKNQAFDIEPNALSPLGFCVTLDTPGPGTTGHLSAFPDVPCEQ